MRTQFNSLYKQQPQRQAANNALEWMQSANNMLKWAQNQSERREIDLKNILRWEEDGGQIVEVSDSIPDLHSTQPYF